MKPAEPVEGFDLLQRWAEGYGHGAQAYIADKGSISRGLVSHWFLRRARPCSVHRLFVEAITGVPAEAWDTEYERHYRDLAKKTERKLHP